MAKPIRIPPGRIRHHRVSAVLPAEGHYRRALRQQVEIVEVVVGRIDAAATPEVKRPTGADQFCDRD